MSRLPGRYRRRLLVRLDGAGFSHELLEHIAAGSGTRGPDWEFSVGWSCTDKEMDAIERLPKDAWTAGIDQNGDLVADTFVAEVTGLLDLGSWHTKIPDLRIIVRDEPGHPRYRKRATERERQLGRRYQLIANQHEGRQVAWLDARHRSHVHVENDVKQAKDLGLNRWPSRHWDSAIFAACLLSRGGGTSPRQREGASPPRVTRADLPTTFGMNTVVASVAGDIPREVHPWQPIPRLVCPRSLGCSLAGPSWQPWSQRP